MVAFTKAGDSLKNTDKDEASFMYRELHEELSEDIVVTCIKSNGNVDDNATSVSRPSLTEVSIYHSDHSEKNSNCMTVLSTFLLVTLICVLLIIGRDYVRNTLLWLEYQEEWIVFVLFVALFTLVSFPFTWGYILLNVACGYLQGLILGIVVVVVAVIVGVLVAHVVIKKFLSEFLKTKLMSNESIRATLAVVGGPHAFRVVAFTRLTPIPFGLQNAIFAISTISTSQYLAATALGLFPTQVINVYLGSTVRSMEDVLTDDTTATTGYIVFIVQVLISVGLMVYVIQRARQELQKTVHFQILSDSKEVSVSQECFKGNCSAI